MHVNIRRVKQVRERGEVYGIRPISSNDKFCFTVRLEFDPELIEGDEVTLQATLLDNNTTLVECEQTLTFSYLYSVYYL